jgi:adenine-specific DNA-methyltransferase
MEVPKTEGIKYTGSKLKLIPHIVHSIEGLEVKSVLDGFTGTTRVAQAFAQLGYDTTCNDISEWSEVFGNCYLLSRKDDAYYQDIIDMLNGLPGYDGWFTELYGGSDDGGKRPFQVHNTRKLDAIRDRIDELGLEWVDKCVILTSLIKAMDAVDNTLGHFASYLSGWSARSHNVMKMELPRRFPITTNNQVLKGDIFDAIKEYHDLVYFDPPYGSNNEKMPPSRVRYASYYHIWKTIILNDKPEVFGKANRREDTHDTISASVFEEYRKGDDGKFLAMQAIDRLIAQTNARYILLSYSSGGRATKQELFDIINSHGRLVSAKEIDYKKNVMAGFSWTNEWLTNPDGNKEYLFLMEK